MPDNPKLTLVLDADNSAAVAKIEATKQAASAATATETRAKADAAVQTRLDDQVKALKQAADVQKLINAGKEREAYILQQIQQAQRNANGSPLQRGQIISVRQAAGATYDARQAGGKNEAVSEMENLRRVVEGSRGIIGGELSETAEKALGLGSSFGKLGGAMMSFGGVAGIAVLAISGIAVAVSKAVEGIAELIRKTTEAAREIKTMAGQLEISYQAYQQLAEMAQQAKVNPQALIMAVGVSSEKIEDARRNPLSESSKQLGRLGLKASEFEGKDATAQFEMIAKAIASIPDMQAKKAALRDMFGRGALQLMDLVNGFERYKESAADVPKIDDDTIKATHDLDLSLNDLKQTLQSLTAETGIIRWLANITANMYGVVKAAKDFAGAGGLGLMKEGVLGGLSSMPYIGKPIAALRFAGRANLFGEGSGSGSAASAAQGGEQADRAKTIDETRNRDVAQMLVSYKDSENTARALTEEERRRLEVQKQIREYNRSHGPDEQISAAKAVEIEAAAMAALAGQRDTDATKTVRGLLDEAAAARAVTAELKQQEEMRKLIRDFEEQHGALTPEQKKQMEGAMSSAYGDRRNANFAELLRQYEDEASAAKATTAELKAQDELRKRIRDFERQSGQLTPEQRQQLEQSSSSALDAKTSTALKEYLKDQRESLSVQELINQRLGREAAILAEVNAARKAAGGSLTMGQEAEAMGRGAANYDTAQKISLRQKLKDLDEQIKLQNLANAGLEKAAYIEGQLYEEEKSRGSKLEGQDRQDFITKTGQLYDAQHSQLQRPEAVRYTSLESYGGGYQGLRSSSMDSTADQVKRSNEILTQMKAVVDDIRSNTKSSAASNSTNYKTAR